MNELQARLSLGQTGLTVVARLRHPGGAQEGADVSCPESGATTGLYSGDVPALTPADIYTVDFVDNGSGRLLTTGELHWDGTQEVTVEDAVSAGGSGITIADVQTALTNQGYTTARALLLDNLDAAISSVLTAIGGLNDLSSSDVETAVQAALTAQGYTVTRAAKLDNLDAAISAVLTAIGGLNDVSIADVQTALTNQGYTAGRAVFLDALPLIYLAVEKVRKVTTNRCVVSVDELTVTIYEDDESTVAFTFTISADKKLRDPN